MSSYSAKVSWQRGKDEAYLDNKYSRGHVWLFDGGVTVPASSSPQIVPLPYSVAQNVDPEEAFVASLSSCHMLFFLAIAAKHRFVVDTYLDEAVGIMAQDAEGKLAMTQVTLRPKIDFSGDRKPTLAQLEQMHHQSHAQCFIANSVKTRVVTEILA
ncbi:OsmC family protein [Shewanella sp. AS16]|uniref:OsmC family protein n=1 Tax=Shewanella sp. AS16 TaxID=2907625 RepID=UPI001F33D08B|nr:OsmC family protein [Shewanella sp. AS16]MCE9687230.1 OsmC family protein [Shewanella sp. AS16]